MRLAHLVLAGFLTAVSAWAEPLRITVISDLNGSYGSTHYGDAVGQAIARIIEIGPDVVISTGDMVAGQRRNPHLSADEVDALWRSFHAMVTKPLRDAGIPLLVTPGNHDASEYDGFEAERRAFDKTWTEYAPDLPILDGERYPFRYAVSIRGVLFVGLDATMVGNLPDEERDWLRQLFAEKRSRHKGVIVFSHLPIWPFAQGRESEILADTELHSILKDADVSAVLSGHHHAYYPGVTDGVLYVSQACLGAGPRKLIGASSVSHRAFSLIEIAEDGTLTERSLGGTAFDTEISLSTLPEALGTGKHMLIRRDLWHR